MYAIKNVCQDVVCEKVGSWVMRGGGLLFFSIVADSTRLTGWCITRWITACSGKEWECNLQINPTPFSNSHPSQSLSASSALCSGNSPPSSILPGTRIYPVVSHHHHRAHYVLIFYNILTMKCTDIPAQPQTPPQPISAAAADLKFPLAFQPLTCNPPPALNPVPSHALIAVPEV